MNKHERISKALHRYAEMRVPDEADPWPEIRESISGDAAVTGSPHSRRFRLVPRTRAGLVFMVLLMMLFGTVGFAAIGWIDELFQDFASEIRESSLGVQLNQKQTVDGITFTLERAYADEDNVVIGYSVEGFQNQFEGYPTSSLPMVSDGSGKAFEYVGGGGMITDPMYKNEGGDRVSDLAFFEPSKKLDVAEKHEFRFELKLNPKARADGQHASSEIGAGRNLVFDFDVPVHEVEVIQIGETVEANGIPMTLERVENSPARTEATLCFDPPRDEKYTWVPVVERPNVAESDVFSNDTLYEVPPEEEIGCVEYDLFRSLYDQPGSHSLTVAEIEGVSPKADDPHWIVSREKIAGPWTFEFEVPER
ncbi:MAG: DUF4179 domain-containing protein [Rubrobacter sp.]|nr:DUF4179 domain-containing protein [Rubrobacter sp.]